MGKINREIGFTLAEVLITLAIIGVIAALTIPALMNFLYEAELIAKWKKSYATISQATQSIVSENGGSLQNLNGATGGYQPNIVEQAYRSKLNVIKFCTLGTTYGKCFHNQTVGQALIGVTLLNGGTAVTNCAQMPFFADMSGQILSDGTYVLYSYWTNLGPAVYLEGYTNSYGSITVDVNGEKKPNVVGKDIFSMLLFDDHIQPVGKGSSKNTCTSATSGFSCSTEKLLQ